MGRTSSLIRRACARLRAAFLPLQLAFKVLNVVLRAHYRAIPERAMTGISALHTGIRA